MPIMVSSYTEDRYFGGCATVLAQHLDNKTTFCLVGLILDANITSFYDAFSPSNIVRSSFKYGLQSLDTQIS